MRFDIISLFPESFTSYFGVSILKRAAEDGLIEIHTHHLRDFTHDKHKTVDDTPYGGGAGMLLKVEPLAEAIEAVVNSKQQVASEEKKRVILFSAKGKTFTQADARRLSEYERLILVCGRYEGVDERVAENFVDEELSIGDYVLTGGELPAMVVVDAVARLLPGVLGNSESAETESHTLSGIVEYPQYTKPEEFRGWRVPDVLLSGHHAEIAKWREKQAKEISEKRNNRNT
ncbi:MAG: tRNA (guanosine(37)-N1)-methyltransferase TrmD [Candidatus Moranbacteria bacterium]|nr:tRNA (guanosine(37)-N1)-methyltransferase TrmD [Candidatus Moranbacteria bacterium]